MRYEVVSCAQLLGESLSAEVAAKGVVDLGTAADADAAAAAVGRDLVRLQVPGGREGLVAHPALVGLVLLGFLHLE